jgi:Flp pilus assembly protein TadG
VKQIGNGSATVSPQFFRIAQGEFFCFAGARLGGDMIAATRFSTGLTLLAKRLPGRGFLADIKGTTAIEFAMISVPFFGLIGAIFETGSAYFRSAQLQLTTETASRAVLTHSTTTGMTYQQFINNNVCTWQTTGTVKPGTLSRMFDCTKVLVDIRSPANWGAADTGNSFYTTPNAGTTVISMPAAGQIAVVRIVYPMTVLSGMFAGSTITGSNYGQIRTGQTQYNGNWSYMLMGIAAFRVEP